MAGFTFNFCVEEDTAYDHGRSPEKEETAEQLDKGSGECSSSRVLNLTISDQTEAEEKVRASKEHSVLPFHRKLLDHVIPSTFQFSSPHHQLQICYVDATSVEKLGKNDMHAIKRTSDSKNRPGSPSESVNHESAGLLPLLELSNSCHSDLIPGVYEGGLKVWECAFDLVEYLAKSEIQFSGMRILELGCGAGLPAIFTLIRGASEVHFQDYNPEVIDYVTIPSVLMNTVESTSDCSCKFYSGDWSKLVQLIPSGYYNIILTSETIYSPTSQPKLLAAVKHLLCPQGGVAYVATKSYYFGVGGSVNLFKELVKRDGYFDIEKCYVIDCEISREILKLQPNLTS